jgi:hypothetical protein
VVCLITIATCAECVKNAGSACTVCKNGTFPPTYVGEDGAVVTIDYIVPEYQTMTAVVVYSVQE